MNSRAGWLLNLRLIKSLETRNINIFFFCYVILQSVRWTIVGIEFAWQTGDKISILTKGNKFISRNFIVEEKWKILQGKGSSKNNPLRPGRYGEVPRLVWFDLGRPTLPHEHLPHVCNTFIPGRVLSRCLWTRQDGIIARDSLDAWTPFYPSLSFTPSLQSFVLPTSRPFGRRQIFKFPAFRFTSTFAIRNSRRIRSSSRTIVRNWRKRIEICNE